MQIVTNILLIFPISKRTKLGVHNIEHQGFNKDQVFGQKSDRNDGVHFNGEWGKGVYADSLKNILKTCGVGVKNKENI